MFSLDESHFSLLTLFLSGLAISLAVGWVFIKLRPGLGRIDSLLLLITPASLFMLTSKWLMMLLTLDQVDWMSGRLAPTFALLRGHTLYYPADSGPIFNTIYPPMAYLVYLPACLASNPTEALITGNTIGYMLILVPILLLCLARHGDEDRNRSLLVSITVFFAFWKSAMVSALITSFTIHADAPALGFGVMACLLLYFGRHNPRPTNRLLFGSALCATLALWSKQTTIPLLVLLPFWVLLTDGFRAAARFAGWIAATVAVVSAAFVVTLGFGPMSFNLLQIPKSHPWSFQFPLSRLSAFLVMGAEESSLCLPPLFAIVALLYLSRRRWMPDAESADQPGRSARLRTWLRANYWMLFALAGFAMVPLSLLSRIKFGGAVSNYAPPLYYFSAAACVLLLDLYARYREQGQHQINNMIKVGILVSSCSPLLLYNFDIMMALGYSRSPYTNSQDQAYNYAKRHPGEVYFPWNPLSSLMAEGKAYHFEYGIFDRELGGFKPTPAHMLSGLPEKLRMVAYPPNRAMEYTRHKFLPEYGRRVEVPELPGWYCYER